MEKVKPCEICNMTYNGTNLNVAGHIVCKRCKKKLRLLKDKTILKILAEDRPYILSYEESMKEQRIEYLKSLIRIGHILKRIQELKKSRKV